jgi:lysophospholipase L1-like esterase
VAFGDSITEGEVISPTSVAGVRPLVIDHAKAYPTLLAKSLDGYYVPQAPILVENKGLKGETAAGGATQLPATLNMGPYQVLLLMIGANDMSGDDPLSALAAVRSMVQYAKSRGLRVLLATITPENGLFCCPRLGNGAPFVQPYNDGIRSIAASEGVTLVDVYAAFGGIATPDLIDFDGLHPTPAGYQRIADTFFASIKQNLQTTSAVLGSSYSREHPFLAPPWRR